MKWQCFYRVGHLKVGYQQYWSAFGRKLETINGPCPGFLKPEERLSETDEVASVLRQLEGMLRNAKMATSSVPTAEVVSLPHSLFTASKNLKK